MDRARQFREAAERHNGDRGRTGWRYPPELRAVAVAHCRERREAGRPFSEIVADLGITLASLSRWQEALAAAPEATEASFLPVAVVEPPAGGSAGSEVRVVTPGGLRIEGLVWAQVLELARVFG